MSDSAEPVSQLEYFISEKNGFAVLSFLGPITKSHAPVVERSTEDLLSCESRRIVLSFHDVTDIDMAGIAALTRMQLLVRKKPADLRLCFLRPELKRMLEERGAIRTAELAPNLKAAIESLSQA